MDGGENERDVYAFISESVFNQVVGGPRYDRIAVKEFWSLGGCKVLRILLPQCKL